MVAEVTGVQDFIAAGQFRGGEQLIDPQQVLRPGTILIMLEPLYEGGLEGVTPGSSCIANAYSSNHDLIASGNVGAVRSLALHAVDAAGWCMRGSCGCRHCCSRFRPSFSVDIDFHSRRVAAAATLS